MCQHKVYVERPWRIRAPNTSPAYFDEKHPPPTLITEDATHPEEPRAGKRGKDIRSGHGDPEIAQSNRHLRVGVEVRQVQNNLASLSDFVPRR